MTCAKIFRSKSGNICGFEIKGHADFAQIGEDIVCAAISAIAQTALIALFDPEGLELSGKSIIDEGHLYAMIDDSLSDERKRDAHIVMNAMRLGLLSLQQTYGEYIKIEEWRV